MNANRDRTSRWPRCLLFAALGFTSVAGCAGTQATAATTVTVPTGPVIEARGATGQLLEDVFFPYAAQSSQFDLDAALDEGGGSYNEGYYDATAAGEYYDETAAGADEGPSAAYYEIRDLDAQLARLEDALRAESHPLVDKVVELRENTADLAAHPEDSLDPERTEAIRSVAPALLSAAQDHVSGAAPRPQHATDCSVATLALYGAVYDLLVEISVDTRMALNDLISNQDEWLIEQQIQLSAAQALVEMLEASPVIPDDPTDLVDQFLEVGDNLYDVDEFLTPGTQAGLVAALTGLGEAASADEARAALATLQTAVLATLAQVPRSPYAAQIEANERLPELVRAAFDALPNPGPRAALRALGQRELRERFSAVEWPTDQVDQVAAWARLACEGSAAP